MKGILPHAPPARKRIVYLDSARALAALSTVVWHFFTAFFDLGRPSFIRDSPFHLFWYGDADVTFFFIHSGFILTYVNRQFLEGITPASYARFLVSRVFRIYPLYLFILLSSYLVATTVYPLSSGRYLTAHFQEFWNVRKSWMDLAREAILVVRIPDNSAARYIPQDWTLTVELLVSGFLPLLSLLMKKRAFLACVVILLLAKLPGLITYVLEFGIGILLFHFMEQIARYWRRMRPVLHWAIGGAALLAATCFFHFSEYLGPRHLLFGVIADRLLAAGGCALSFVVILNSARVQKILSWPWLVRLGEVCYGLYLFHMLLLIAGADYGMQLLVTRTALPRWADMVILLVVVLAATIGLSFIFFYLIERPLNRFGKQLGGLIGRRSISNRISFLK